MYFSILSVTVAIGLVSHNRLTIPFRVLLYFLVYTLIHEVLVHIQWHTYGLYWIYAIAQSFIYPFIFYLALHDKAKRTWLVVLLLIITGINVGVSIGQFAEVFPSKIILRTTPIMLLYSLVLYWHLLNSDMETPMRKKGLFWLNTAFFVYMTVTFTHLSMYQFLLETNAIKTLSQNLHKYVCLAYYSTLGYATWLDSRQFSRGARLSG